MPVPSARPFLNKNNVGGTAIAGNAEVVLQLGPPTTKVKVNLMSAQLRRKTNGGGGNYTQRVANAPGGAAGDASQKWAGAATAPGTMASVKDINQPMETDALGRLYYTPGVGDALDTYEYDLWFEAIQ